MCGKPTYLSMIAFNYVIRCKINGRCKDERNNGKKNRHDTSV
ncbi:MAG: hypothetical protein PWQ37_1515 [Candidatus Petromonas sp.]|jgi:hypothetical protein|nr:hypothetical protein [Candidatus Petromonas sp.]